jgi:hypothetical protein
MTNMTGRITTTALSILMFTNLASAAIQGCTSDVRTGVCNSVCRVSHVAGCTVDQFQPLASIHSMDCLAATVTLEVSTEDKAVARDECSKQTDKLIQEWKDAQKKMRTK